jgi:hypothetical protein
MPRHLALTDHAFVRYFERVHGIKREDILEEMIGTKAAKFMRLPNGHFARDGYTLVVKDNVVTTVLPRRKNKSKKSLASNGD